MHPRVLQQRGESTFTHLNSDFHTMHAIENRANQNAGKPLYIRQYSNEPSHRSVQFNCMYHAQSSHLATVFCVAGYEIVMQPFSWYNRVISHSSRVTRGIFRVYHSNTLHINWYIHSGLNQTSFSCCCCYYYYCCCSWKVVVSCNYLDRVTACTISSACLLCKYVPVTQFQNHTVILHFLRH